MALPAPSYAQGGTVIWGGLTAGMTQEQVSAKYPSGEAALGDECKAQIVPHIRSRGLEAIVLRIKVVGKDNYTNRNRCADTMRKSFLAKYGNLISTEKTEAKQFFQANVSDV